MGLVLAGLVLAALFSPAVRRKRPTGQTEAVHNLRQIGMALFEFEAEFGAFPNESTAALVKQKSGSALTLGGHSSNDLFVQLLAAGISQSEAMFYAKAKSAKKPDNDWTSDATALAHGECSYAYVAGLDASTSLSAPIAFGPVIPGTRTFDIKPNRGKVAVFRMDNSVASVPITPEGKILYHGHDLLDPAHPVWGGKIPDLRWPK